LASEAEDRLAKLKTKSGEDLNAEQESDQDDEG